MTPLFPYIGLPALLLALGGCTKPQEDSKTETATDSGDSPSEWQMVSAGHSHSCAINGQSEVECWGFDRFGQSTPPAGTFESVHAGMHHTCARSSSGEVQCWGFNAFGAAQAPSLEFQSISAGGYQTCGVLEDGTVECWGGIRDGESDPPSGQFRSVSGGEGHTCGVTESGSLACWGFDMFGQASPPSGSFQSVSAGWAHSCGLRDTGLVECWGHNLNEETTAPAGEFLSVSAGKYFSCGITIDGAASCWGLSENGETLPPSGSYQSVSAGGDHACAVTTDGLVSCWGATTDPDSRTDPETGIIPEGISVEGIAWNYGKFDWAEEGKCIQVTDPGPALFGSPASILSSSTIAAGGAFQVKNVSTDSALGLFMTVDDCDESSGAIRSANGIGPDAYVNLGDGETLGERMVLVIDEATAAEFDESLQSVGYTGEALATTGAILGFIVDSNMAFLDGATLDCENTSGDDCPAVYYLDGDATDGLFGSGSSPNTATLAAAEALFLIPDSVLTYYVAAHADYTFSRELFGNADSTITVLMFVGH